MWGKRGREEIERKKRGGSKKGGTEGRGRELDKRKGGGGGKIMHGYFNGGRRESLE